MKTLSLKTSLGFLFAVLLSNITYSQKPIASPRDSVSGKIGKTGVSINYGSPSVKGRKIWGDLVPYGKVWRAGANEATTFTTDKPVQIEGKTLPAGQYGFFVIPTETTWTIIFNKTAKQWGSYDYDAKQDALRVTVTPKKAAGTQERLSYKVTSTGFSLVWENLEVPVAVH